MSTNGLRRGAIALAVGGALTGALVIGGGALVSAQTADETPTAEDATQTPAETSPTVVPEDKAPADSTGTAGDTDRPSDAEGAPFEHRGHDGECDKDGDGQPDAGMDGSGTPGGTRFNGAGPRNGGFAQ